MENQKTYTEEEVILMLTEAIEIYSDYDECASQKRAYYILDNYNDKNKQNG